MRTIYLTILSLVAVFAGCRTTKIPNSWKGNDYVSKKYAKILVMAIMRDEDVSMRRNIETHLSAVLHDKGIEAETSLDLLGIHVFEKMDEEDAIHQLNYHCADAVVTVTLLDRLKEKEYTPGIIHYSPYAYYYDRFWHYRATMKRRYNTVGYYGNDLFLESNIYDMVTQKLVYSVQSASFHYSDYEKELNQIAPQIIAALTGPDRLSTVIFEYPNGWPTYRNQLRG